MSCHLRGAGLGRAHAFALPASLSLPQPRLSDRCVSAALRSPIDALSLVALVVRLGGGMEIVPIVEGAVLESAAQRNPDLGGHLIDSMLVELLAKRNVRTSSLVETYLWRLVKERHAFVSLDPEQDLALAEQDPQR